MRVLKVRLTAVWLSAVAALVLGASLSSALAGGPPSSGPVAGPIEVFTDASPSVGPFGTLLDTTLTVVNNGNRPVSVYLYGTFDWPDGSRQRLRYGPPLTLEPNGAVIFLALSLVPDDAGSGTGTFTGTAIVSNVGPDQRRGNQGPLIAQDRSTFTLP